MSNPDLMEQEGHVSVLAFDTSTAVMAAAILQDGELVNEIQSRAERNHALHVMTHLKQMMQDSNMNRTELGVIVAGQGPGSYTGMRIAVTAAKTLAWTWGVPLVGVSSLEAIAYGAYHHIVEGQDDVDLQWIIPIMDARRGQVYNAMFSSDAQHHWGRVLQDGVRMMNSFVQELIHLVETRNAEQSHRIAIVGDLSLHQTAIDQFKVHAESLGVQVIAYSYELEGRFVAELGRKKWLNGETSEIHSFVPEYTQLTEAETKLKERQRTGEN